jgi:hypothetical protein
MYVLRTHVDTHIQCMYVCIYILDTLKIFPVTLRLRNRKQYNHLSYISLKITPICH